MATRQDIVDFIVEQLAGARDVTARKMFGEFALYSQGKVVALVCDDQLFVKPTDAGRSFIGTVSEGQPYPGAKPCFLIAGDQWEDGDWLSELIRLTARELPLPKAKTKASSKTKTQTKRKTTSKAEGTKRKSTRKRKL